MSTPKAPKPSTITDDVVQSFCARVINLCFEVEGANGLSHLQSLREIAAALRHESEGIQDIYGGRMPRKGKTK